MPTKQTVNRRRKSTKVNNVECGTRDGQAAMVMQRELRLLKLLRALDALNHELRNDIVARIENGEPIEPGDLVAKLTSQVSKRITFERLVEVVGNKEACSICDAIKPLPYVRLDVEKRRPRYARRSKHDRIDCE